MLNFVMTNSPRIAAVVVNKPYGDDLIKNLAILHRIEWLRKDRDEAVPILPQPFEPELRERLA